MTSVHTLSPEEATQDFKLFLQNSERKFEILLTAGEIFDGINISDVTYYADYRTNDIVTCQRREIQLSREELSFRIIYEDLPDTKLKKVTTTSNLKRILPNPITKEEEDFFFDNLGMAKMLGISEEVAKLLVILLIDDFGAFQRFFIQK